MGLLNELGIAPTDHVPPPEDLDKSMSHGDLPPEGVHHAILQQVGPIPNAAGRGWKMIFEIIAGPAKGFTVEEALWKPKGEDEKKDKVTHNKVLLFGHRLGLLKKMVGTDGKEKSVEVEGKHDFNDCLGTPCFIDVIHEDETYEKGGKSRTIKKAKLAFKGLLSPDDKKVKEGKVPTATMQAVLGAKNAAAAKPKDNYDAL